MESHRIGLNCLVLHPDYSPISLFPLETIPVEKAIQRVLDNNCDCVLTYKRKILTPSHDDWYWPSIIVNRHFYKKYGDARLKHETLYYRDHGICQYCEKPLTVRNITCDHVLPTSKGGKNDWENVVASCQDCNTKKDNALPRGIWKPKREPYKPTLQELVNRRKNFPLVVDDPNWKDYIGHDWNAPIYVREAAATAHKMYNIEV